MVTLKEITHEIESYLMHDKFQDASWNGLQVEGAPEVQKVAFAVDSGLSVVQKAVEAQAQLLIVHHGLFWGNGARITGPMGARVGALIHAGCSLFASHLPLDSHLEVGNGAELAREIKLENLEPYMMYDGNTVGVRGEFPHALSISEVVERCKSFSLGLEPFVLQFGTKEIKKVAVVTGSGAFAISNCTEDGIDLLISGEQKQDAYHEAKDRSFNTIFAGHYATETFGVKALMRWVASKWDVETCYIEENTGI